MVFTCNYLCHLQVFNKPTPRSTPSWLCTSPVVSVEQSTEHALKSHSSQFWQLDVHLVVMSIHVYMCNYDDPL